MTEAQTIKTDVLVIGGGGAGFRAAIAAREKGVKTMMISKGPLARCGATPMAGADYTLDGSSMSQIEGLPGDPNDSKEKVFNDIVTQGFYLNNQKLVEHYIDRAQQCLQELIDWGLKVKLSDQRMIFTSGIHLMNVLLRKAKKIGVDLVEDVAIFELLTKNGEVNGALGIDIKSGQFIRYQAKAVVMATGGWHKAFWPNTGMRDLSGEGLAMAFRAGAEIGNMEFITFICNAFYSPPIWRGSIAPYILVTTCGGQFTNTDGDDILASYDPLLQEKGLLTEWNKSFISHASAKEIRDGKGSPNGGVYYSRGAVPWNFIEAVSNVVFPNWKYKAMDLSKWKDMLENNIPAEVGPAVEYFEGGMVVNERMETTLPGLYGAGECILGVFGANRVFSAITEIFVQGLDAGQNAADYADKLTEQPLDANQCRQIEEILLQPLQRKEGIQPASLRRIMAEKAHQQLGPIRHGYELTDFLTYLEGIKLNELPNLAAVSKSLTYNKEWIEALELMNMQQLLEISTRCAINRTESRGVHYREDYPDTDNDQWLKESRVKFSNGESKFGFNPIVTTHMSPPSGKVPYLDFMKQMMAAHSDTGGKH